MRCLLIFTTALLMLSSGGCIAARFAVGTGEPKVSNIRPGQPRAKVERMLGRPIGRHAVAGGHIDDTYEYFASLKPEYWAAAGMVTADAMTLGATEPMLWGIYQYTRPRKRVTISYDHNDQVAGVTDPVVVEDYLETTTIRGMTLHPSNDSGATSASGRTSP